MKKILFTVLLTSTILTSTVSWSYRPDWSYTIPGVIDSGIGGTLLYTVLRTDSKIPKELCVQLRKGNYIDALMWSTLVTSVILIPKGMYSLYKGLIANRSSSPQNSEKTA